MKRTAIARSKRKTSILICRKCLKRSAEGRQIRREIKRKLKRQPKESVKRAKLLTTGCFGICPKKAVVLASSNSLAKGEYLLVAQRAEAEEALTFLQAD